MTTPSLAVGTAVLAPDGAVFRVDQALASKFQPGDALAVDPTAGLLHIPAADRATAAAAVLRAADAFNALAGASDRQLLTFYEDAAKRLADEAVWATIQRVNDADVAAARQRGRSTTRLVASESMRTGMIDGLRVWANAASGRGQIIESVAHQTFDVHTQGAALGVVAFVFEGRPNVVADACGVLKGGNTVVFRIGGDALATAKAILAGVIHPALEQADLPTGAVSIVDSTSHAAGWALFLDARLSLAVARGSGSAVDLLGALARSVGTPVSLHGTGGAWLTAAASATPEQVQRAVTRSLDRKVCNSLNTCCVVRERADELVPAVLAGLDAAGAARTQSYKLHVAVGSEPYVPAALFTTDVTVVRSSGPQQERQAEPIAIDALGTEWEWEETPEMTLVVVDDLAEAVSLFNTYSPLLVGTLLSAVGAEHEWFYEALNAPFIGDDHTRWVDGQFALNRPELGLSNWANGRLFARGGVLSGDSVYTVKTRYVTRQ